MTHLMPSILPEGIFLFFVSVIFYGSGPESLQSRRAADIIKMAPDFLRASDFLRATDFIWCLTLDGVDFIGQ